MKSTFLSLLGVSIGMGAVLGLAPINPVHAGSFNREIVDPNGHKMGRIAFTWDDSIVTNNMLKGFNSLNSFYVTDYGEMNYDLEFAKNTLFQNFDFNLSNGKLKILGANPSSETPTGQYGFTIWSKDFDSDVISSGAIAASTPIPTNQALNQAVNKNRYLTNLNLGDSNVPTDGTTLQPVEQESQSVPENSLTTALLIVAGLVFFGPHKIF
ncbi:MAG: hypothetical protein QNJ42_10120 [Crocosphaera sp.]|nr:hypothetical protein [Crocosphaera sp.]